MGTRVHLNVYDLSDVNDCLYPIGFGLHHSGVEILGSEYSFASGAGIFTTAPKVVPNAKFREQIHLGDFDGGSVELRKVLDDLEEDFGPTDYNLVRKNCNHFANALCWKLLRRQIPGHVNRLADVAMCCSCFLPRSLLEHAPVGDPNEGATGSFMARDKPATSSVAAFTGAGSRLNGSSQASALPQGIFGRALVSNAAGTPQSPMADDLTDRRERARKAALARLEKQQDESKQS